MKKIKSIKNFISKNSLTITMTILVLSVSLFLLLFTRVESDYFWHITAGKYILNNGILRYDVFSWYLNSKYWMSHEWLFEIIIYLLSLISSKYHILIYEYISISSLLLILFYKNKKNYLRNIPFSILWIMLSLILMMYVQGRPHLLSFNLLALTIYLLYDNYYNKDSKLIYFLPIITIIWSNIHGGSSNLSYLFCLVFLIGSLFNFKTVKLEATRLSKKQIFKYLIVMILCMIAVNVNIHGFKMFIYPYQNMKDSLMLSSISEWMPTNLNNPGHLIYFIFLVFILMVMLISKKKINLVDLLLFGICIFLGLKSIRFWGYTYIIMSYVIFNYISKRKLDNGTNIVIITLSVLLVLGFVLNIKTINKNLEKRELSSDIINTIREEKPKRLFNMYNYGGELIYNDILVFIDGRADLYSKYNYKDYLDISTLKGNYVELIDKYNFDYFLTDRKYSIDSYLKYNDNYELIYQNKHSNIYKKVVNN